MIEMILTLLNLTMWSAVSRKGLEEEGIEITNRKKVSGSKASDNDMRANDGILSWWAVECGEDSSEGKV